MVAKKYDWSRARSLYDAGCNDREIARRLGVKHPESVKNWRTRNGLASHMNFRTGQDLAGQIRRLLKRGKNVKQIAYELDCSDAYVRATRRRTTEVNRLEKQTYRARHLALIGLA